MMILIMMLKKGLPGFYFFTKEDIKLADGRFLLTFHVGDNGDGHMQEDLMLYYSTLSVNEFDAAYEAGVAVLGDNVTSYCHNYESNRIPSKLSKALDAAGFIPIEERGFNMEYPDYLDASSFTQIVLFTAKLGNPTFTYSKVKYPQFDIGGYGLYRN